MKKSNKTTAAAKKTAAEAKNAEVKVKLDEMLASARQDGTQASLLSWFNEAEKSPLYLKGMNEASFKSYRLAKALVENHKAIAELTSDVQPIAANDDAILKLDSGRALTYFLLGSKAFDLKKSVGHGNWLPLLQLLNLPESTIARSLRIYKLWQKTRNAAKKLENQTLEFAEAGPEPKPHKANPMEAAIAESKLSLQRIWNSATRRITDAVIGDEEKNAVATLISKFGDEKVMCVVAKLIFDKVFAEKKPSTPMPESAAK